MSDYDESLFNSAEDRIAFLEWRKGKRRTAIVEGISALLAVALLALSVFLWFAAEGFIPCAN